MKGRWLSVILIAVMALSLLVGCSKGSKSTSDSNIIYGEVSKIENNVITIKVGTMNKMERSSDKNGGDEKPVSTGNASDDASEQLRQGPFKGGDRPSMLDFTGEEREIKVTDTAVITKQQGGGKIGIPPKQQSGGHHDVPPEMPSEGSPNDNNQENSPKMPEGESDIVEKESIGEQKSEEISLEDISEGDIVAIMLDDNGNANEIKVMSMGQLGNDQNGQIESVGSYTSVNEYTADAVVENKTIDSTGTDENAIYVSNGAVKLKNIDVTRISSNSTGGDKSSFYGVGAAVLTTEGSSYINDSKITTNAAGAAGIFAYSEGTVYAADTTIKTRQSTSGGIHVAGGGTLYAWDMNVETGGQSSAAIRSDRGSGKMVINGGTYISNGIGSPAIYSTADIAVNNADLTANGSEAICIEGLNSIRLYNSDLTGNMNDDSQNDCTWNIILYQSMSGDSEIGKSTFEMNGGTLRAKNGGMFYTTNTESVITLKDVDITYASDSEFFLRCTGNNNQRGWGKSGANGAECLFTAKKQKMEGNVIWDSISKLDFYMTDKSTLKGAIIDDETYAGDSKDGYCNIYIEKGSAWIVTGNSTVSKLNNAGTIKDVEGKTVTIKGTDETVYVKGNGDYTITVDSYSTTADVSGASTATSWSDYKVEKPSELS